MKDNPEYIENPENLSGNPKIPGMLGNQDSFWLSRVSIVQKGVMGQDAINAQYDRRVAFYLKCF